MLLLIYAVQQQKLLMILWGKMNYVLACTLIALTLVKAFLFLQFYP